VRRVPVPVIFAAVYARALPGERHPSLSETAGGGDGSRRACEPCLCTALQAGVSPLALPSAAGAVARAAEPACHAGEMLTKCLHIHHQGTLCTTRHDRQNRDDAQAQHPKPASQLDEQRMHFCSRAPHRASKHRVRHLAQRLRLLRAQRLRLHQAALAQGQRKL